MLLLLSMLLLFLQVLCILTNWKWLKTALDILFVIWLALVTGTLISIFPCLMNILSELVMML